MNISFFIDTPEEYIISWLHDYTRDAPYQLFPTEKGRIIIQRTRKSIIGNKTLMLMQGMYIIPSGSDSEQGFLLGNSIEFEIIPLTPEKVEFNAKCNQPVLNNYFINILIEIKKRWPQPEDVTAKIDELKEIIQREFNEIKLSQTAIYSGLIEGQKESISKILYEIDKGNISQAEISITLESVRKALKHFQAYQKSINKTLSSELNDIERMLESELSIKQQLELTLPVIPFLVNYKLSIDAGVDIESVWKDLLTKII